MVLYAQNARTLLKNDLADGHDLVARRGHLPSVGRPPQSSTRCRARWAAGRSSSPSFARLHRPFVEPFAIAALMQVYFKVIEGQVPDPEWDRRLAESRGIFAS